jgi:hypothetical protein
LPRKGKFFNAASLSRATMTRRVEDIIRDLDNQIRNKAKVFESFSLALDEINDTSDTAQLFVA